MYYLKWPQDLIFALGTAFSCDSHKCDVKNIHDEGTNIHKMFHLWSQKDLSLCSKITIANTLGLSKLIFCNASLPTPLCIVSNIHVDKVVTAFVWNNKPAKVKRENVIGPKGIRGLDLPDYESIKNLYLWHGLKE